MAPTHAVSSALRLLHPSRFAAALRLLLLVAIVFAPLSAAGQAFAQQQPSTPFPRSAAFLPSPTGFFLAVNLAPDQAQRTTLDRLFNYYMQDPDVSRGWRELWDSAVPGMTGAQLHEGIASWIGTEAFIAIPSPGALSRMMQFSMMMSPADIPFLGGIAVRDPAGLLAFLANVGSAVGSEDGGPGEMTTTVHNGMTVMTFPSRNGPPVHVAMPAGFMIFSTDQQVVFEALDRTPTTSLASSAGFQELMRTAQQPPLAVFYADNPGAIAGASMMPGMPNLPMDMTAWSGATIRIDNQGLRADQIGALNPDRLTPAMRALATTAANPYQTARLAPRDSSVLLAITRLDLIWALIREIMAGSPDTSDMIGEATIMFRAATGLDLDRDIFGWMTGEAGFFVSPGGPEAPVGIGGGLIIQAPDAATAQERVAAIVNALTRAAPLDMVVEPVVIGGASFNRIRSVTSNEFTVYLGSVGPWVLATDAEALTAGIVQRAGNASEQGLAGDAAFTALRGAAPSPSQNMVYVDITGLTDMIISAANPPSRDAAQVRFFLAPFKRLMMSGTSTAERSRATIVLQIVVP